MITLAIALLASLSSACGDDAVEGSPRVGQITVGLGDGHESIEITPYLDGHRIGDCEDTDGTEDTGYSGDDIDDGLWPAPPRIPSP